MATKKVNIKVLSRPIRALSIPIRGDIHNVDLEVSDIQKIILEKGIVDEILPDGTTVRLNLSNYDNMNLAEEVKQKQEADRKAKEEAELERERDLAIARKNKENREKLLNEQNQKKNTQNKKSEEKTVEVKAEEKTSEVKVEEKKQPAYEEKKVEAVKNEESKK